MEISGECLVDEHYKMQLLFLLGWHFISLICYLQQVDTYGLCVVVHMMLHNAYMEIEKKATSDGNFIYLPRASFKRYLFLHT